MTNNRIVQVLCIKPFLFLWLAEVFSQIAFNMVNFVLILLIFKLTNSNFAVSALVISFTIPAIFFGIIAGAYVDRWNKKYVLFLSNIIRAIILILLSFFHANVIFIYPLAFISAVVTQFFIPAETPMIPLVVKKKDFFLSANALFGLGLFGSILLAYVLSGPFLLILGQQYIFFVLALFFVLASIFIILIKVPKKSEDKIEGRKSDQNLITDVKSALSMIVKTKKIYNSLLLLTLIQVIILVLATIGPGYASQILSIKIDEFPIYIVTTLVFGLIIGSIIIGNFFEKISKNKLSTIGVFLAGLTIMALPYGSKVTSRSFVTAVNEFLPKIMVIDILHIMIFLSVVLGFALSLIFVPSNTVLQEETEDEFRGKVYGALNALVGVSSLFPIIIAGELADIFGVGKVLSGIGVILIFIGIARVAM